MRLSFLQILFLFILFLILFLTNSTFLTTIYNSIKSFLQSVKKHNSIRK